MKKFSFGLIVVFGVLGISCATTGEKITEPLRYSEVVEIADVSDSELYTKVNMWFVDVFNNAGSVIQFSDKESGVIKGKYIGDNIVEGVYICKLTTTITVEIKDGKYRISFTDPMYQYIGSIFGGAPYTNTGTENVVTVEMANKVKAEWLKVSENLKSTISTPASSW
jgi:archaellum component FlaF (FlaF/FlaG flagellin family)